MRQFFPNLACGLLHKTEIRQIMRKRLVLFGLLLVFPAPLLALDPLAPPTASDLAQPPAFEPSGKYYNQLPQPQFVFEDLGEGKTFNGGLGNGECW